jgi:hypothetical protein
MKAYLEVEARYLHASRFLSLVYSVIHLVTKYGIGHVKFGLQYKLQNL